MVEEKTFLVIDVCQILNRSIHEHNLAWGDMVNHHCFKGNNTMMVFGHFWSEGLSYKELLEYEYAGAFTLFITKWLEDNGFGHYNHDDVLIKISW